MSIQYSESANSITIADKEKNQLMLLRFAFSISFLQVISVIDDFYEADIGMITYLRIFLVTVSLIALFFLGVRRTWKNNLNVDEIKHLRERVTFGRRNFSFLLKNGKVRDLREVSDKTKTEALLALCKEAGISTIYKEVI